MANSLHVSFNWILSFWKLECWRGYLFCVPVYNLLEHFLSRFQMWTFHFALYASFFIGFGNGLWIVPVLGWFCESNLVTVIWKPDPTWWKPHNRTYADILSICWDIRNPHFSYSYISVYTNMRENYDIQFGHNLLFYDVWISAQAPPNGSHDSTSYGGVKNEKTVWRRIPVTQYIYVYSTGMYWVYPGIYLVFAKARTPKFCHAFNLSFIVYKCTDTPPKHSTLYFGAKSEKRICADHEFCILWLYWYVLVHSRTFSYILVHTRTLVHAVIHHHVLRIRLEEPCDDILSLVHSCTVHHLRLESIEIG